MLPTALSAPARAALVLSLSVFLIQVAVPCR